MPRSQSLFEKIKALKIDWLIFGSIAAYLLILNFVLLLWSEILTIRFLLVSMLIFLAPPLIFGTVKEDRIDWKKVTSWAVTDGPFYLICLAIGASIVMTLFLFFLSGIE